MAAPEVRRRKSGNSAPGTHWAPGARVRIVGTPSGVRLTASTGTVVGPDPDWGGYYVVRLDAPATYYCRGQDEPLDEITEAADNIRSL